MKSSFNLWSTLGLTGSCFGANYVILYSFPPRGFPPFFFISFAFFRVSFSSSYIAKSSWMSNPENMDVLSASLTLIENYRAMPSARSLPNLMKSSSLNCTVASVSGSVYPQQELSIVYELSSSKSLKIPNLAQFFLYFSFPNLQPA